MLPKPQWLVVVIGLAAASCGAERAPFWRVEAGSATSYLLGTIHRGVDANLLPPQVWDALSSSRLLMTEADVRNVNPTAFDTLVTLPAGVTVQQSVSQEDWALMLDALGPLFDPARLNSLQPWFTNGALISSYLPEGDDMDSVLVTRAAAAGVQLGFFESWQQQGQMLNAVGVADALIPLLQVVRDPVTAKATLQQWADAYRAADLTALEALTLHPDDIAARQRYYDDIVFGRTDTWLPTIAAEITTGGAFVGVGFTHLIGERGIVAKLRSNGYSVEESF